MEAHCKEIIKFLKHRATGGTVSEISGKEKSFNRLIDRDFEEIQDFVENAQLFKEGRSWQNRDVGNEWTSFNFPKLGQKPVA